MGSPDLRSIANLKTPHPFPSSTKNLSSVAHFGLIMRHHTKTIAFIQWSMVVLYLFLLLAPFIFPDPAETPFSWKDLQLLSVFIFWGFGWPLIILSTMIFGRIWCGIFCPDGTLTETISHHGQKRSIPRWIRWPGWPYLTLLSYTIAFCLSNATYNHLGTSILLGSLTLACALTGFLYGNGRRIWCMYLCPSNSIFIYLAKLSFFHFRVDPKKWDAYKNPVEPIHCAPLINIKQMKSASACHACGRCSSHRDAVELAIRAPDREILSDVSKQTHTVEALTLFFGLTGICTAAFLFTKYPFIYFYATENAVHTPLLFMFALVSGTGILLGLFFWGMTWLSYKTISHATVSWQQLSLGMIPLAGTGFFLGLTTSTLSFFQPAAWVMQSILLSQLALLAVAFLFSFWLGWRLLIREKNIRNVMAMIIYGTALGILGIIWAIQLWA
ncbi:MAG: 4Fe-4S binding protein [Betaproteobacteria bacterium]|nr:4Fe-4S binding protein [Betaproteobacteria bacterium]